MKTILDTSFEWNWHETTNICGKKIKLAANDKEKVNLVVLRFFNPFAPAAREDPRPFYRLWRHPF